MAKLQPPRGTHDLYGDDARRHRHVVESSLEISQTYGYGEIATPIFEFTEVFKRTLGEVSDVVSKEMYTFDDRGQESITLRPEGTAGVARALITGGMTQNLPQRFFYQGPMFRYERPQKGRQRQFHQIGIETLGVAQPQADVEVIACGADILERLGILSRTVLELNTLGDSESRTAYRTALIDYFRSHTGSLSEDSIRRLDVNPLRILDSKDEGDRKIVETAPSFDDYLNPLSQDFFVTVTGGLDALGIAWQRNTKLVRGLDYYCHTAFEFVTQDLGAQGTVMGGGRYDGLVEMMGGPAVPGVGWAAGIERLAMLVENVPSEPAPIAIVALGEAGEIEGLKLAHTLRKAGFRVEQSFSGNMGKRMKRADKIGATAALILGDDELAKSVVQVRDLRAGEQAEVPLNEIVEHLARFR